MLTLPNYERKAKQNDENIYKIVNLFKELYLRLYILNKI